MTLKFDGEPLLPPFILAAAAWGAALSGALLALIVVTRAPLPLWVCLPGLLPALWVMGSLFGLVSGAAALVALCRLLTMRDGLRKPPSARP